MYMTKMKRIENPNIHSEDIGIEFGIEKCAKLIMKSRKRHMTEGIKLEIKRKKERSGKRKLLGILEVDTIKQAKIKETI